MLIPLDRRCPLVYAAVPDMATIEQAIGQEVRRRREAAGVGQSAVAGAARQYGLPWTRAMVAAVELGRRRLTLGELALLPLVLGSAGVTAGPLLTLADLIPVSDQQVSAGPSLAMPLRIARALLLEGGDELKSVPRVVAPGHVARRTLEAAGDAEQKAATALHVSPEAVVEAAHQRWGRSLTAERERRVEAYTRPMLTRDPAEAVSPEWPRRLQAIRGHVTRELLKELTARPTARRSPRKRGQ